MSNLAEVWKNSLPEIMKNVTGVGVWTALRSSIPIAFEQETIVLGLPGEDQELAGHLRIPQTRRAIEVELAKHFNSKVNLRVINGVTNEDWETEKKRDEEKQRLQNAALVRQKAELIAGRSWDSVFEQVSRTYAGMANRSLPQVRAAFFLQAIQIVSDALLDTPINDDMAERGYARVLERVAHYCELPSSYVALKVMEKAFKGE